MTFWKDQKVLVAGGAGFIGSNLVKHLVQNGAKVRVVDNLERGKLEDLDPVMDAIEFLQKDLRVKNNCLEACSNMEIVFQLAAKVGGIGYYLEKPAEVLNQNILLDTLMLEAAREKKVSRYLYASSAHVYPKPLQTEPDSPPLKEEQAIPANPDLSYGWEKLMVEQEIKYLLGENPNFKAAIVRIFGAFGGNQDIDLQTASAIPAFCRRAIEYPNRKPFKVLSSGRETRSYCYITDVVRALMKSVEKLDQTQLVGPLNVGTEDRISIRELAEKIVEISGKDIDIVFNESNSTTIWGQAPDCTKAKEFLAWAPQLSLEEGLEKTYREIEKRLMDEK